MRLRWHVCAKRCRSPPRSTTTAPTTPVTSVPVNQVQPAKPLMVKKRICEQVDEDTLRDWFGRFITRYRNAQTPAAPARPFTVDALRKRLEGGASLLRHPWSRLAWSRARRGAVLFANGQAWPAGVELAQRLCAQLELVFDDVPDDSALVLLLGLVNDGHLVPHKARRR